MAIKIGTTDIGKVYVGTTEVAKIYKGTELIYSASPTPQPTLSNKIYGHTRTASSTITLKVNGTSYNVTSDADKYFELDCSGITITSLNQCAYSQGQLGDITFDIDTANCTDFSYMCGSAYATKFDLSKVDTSKATNFAAMFYNCQSATTIIPPENGFTHAYNLNSMQFMFYNCKLITSFDLSALGDIYYVYSANGMFQSCSALQTIDFSNLERIEPNTANNMFAGCSSLTSIKVANVGEGVVTYLLARLSDAGLSFVQSGDYLIPQS